MSNGKRFSLGKECYFLIIDPLHSGFLSTSHHSQKGEEVDREQIIIRDANKISFCVCGLQSLFFIKESIIYHYWQEKELPLRPTADKK